MHDSTPIPNQVTATRLRLDYLDGLRGLACLAVVLYHASDTTWGWQQGASVSRLARLVGKPLNYGFFAVAIFIVLSGYCLMLPVARSAEGSLRGGMGEYFKRRALRILPPYYAATLFSLALIVLVPRLNHPVGNYWDAAIPAFTPGVLLSHLFVVHNLSTAWNFRIAPPHWSVATEWHIYFVFPLILLPVWRRFGLAAATMAGMALGLLPHFLLPSAYRFDVARPWFIGLFALGMAAAVMNFSKLPSLTALRERTPWGIMTLMLTLLLLAFNVVGRLRMWWWAQLWFAETHIGLLTACLIIYCTCALTQPTMEAKPAIVRLLQAKPSVALGVFSYSIYLVHAPILALYNALIFPLPLSPTLRWASMLLVGVPLAIGVSYLFHLVCERRFMPGHPRTQKKAETAAALSPAP